MRLHYMGRIHANQMFSCDAARSVAGYRAGHCGRLVDCSVHPAWKKQKLPREIPWHWVRVEKDSHAPTQARSLATLSRQDQSRQDHAGAGSPKNAAKLFLQNLPEGDHIYYFATDASVIAADIFRFFETVSCEQPPDLDNLTLVV
jgi:hypothetical protein